MKISKIIPIDKFVEKALYHNQYGYYSNKNPFGKSGDFITAPGISSLFSEMIAIWIISLWKNLNEPKKFNIVELGPGNGELCKILIKTFKKFPDFYKSSNIFLYEKSKILRDVQKKNIKEKKIIWLKNFKKIKNWGGPFFNFLNIFI